MLEVVSIDHRKWPKLVGHRFAGSGRFLFHLRLTNINTKTAFSALMLLVGRQEWHPSL